MAQPLDDLETSGPDGRYELTLGRPGAYLVAVDLESDDVGIEFYVDVPDAAELEHDLELPTGRIAGRVVGPDGAPVAGAGLQLEHEGGSFGLSDASMGAQIYSDGDGTFALEHLWPGTYALRVRSPDPGHGIAILGGLEARLESTGSQSLAREENGAGEDHRCEAKRP